MPRKSLEVLPLGIITGKEGAGSGESTSALTLPCHRLLQIKQRRTLPLSRSSLHGSDSVELFLVRCFKTDKGTRMVVLAMPQRKCVLLSPSSSFRAAKENAV